MLNWVDVSDKTVNDEWRQLLVKYDINPITMVEAVGLDSPLIDPEESAKIIAEKEAAGRAETFNLVQKMIRAPLRKFFDWQCPEWHVSDAELYEVADAYAEVFAKHFPMFYENPYIQKLEQFIEDMGAEIKAVTRTFKMMRKYKDKPRKLPKPETQTETQKKETQAANPKPFVGREEKE